MYVYGVGVSDGVFERVQFWGTRAHDQQVQGTPLDHTPYLHTMIQPSVCPPNKINPAPGSST